MPRVLPGPLIVVQVRATGDFPAASAEGLLRTDLGEGGRLVLVRPDGATRVLSRGFASAADPEVSFDGGRILFAGQRRRNDPWCLHEMLADGSAVRRITCGPGSARHGVFLPEMHTLTQTATEAWDQVAFVGTRPGETNEQGTGEARSLYACRRDGTALRRLTFNLSSDIDPAVLPDGRLVYASWQRSTPAHGTEGRFVLLAVNTDGTDPVPYAVEEGRRAKQMPAVTTGERVVFVEADALAGDGAGSIAAVDIARPLHSHRELTQAADGLFLAPSALPDGSVLVSWRPPRGGDHGVYRLDPATGRSEKIFDEPGWHDVQARLLAPRPVPDGRSSPLRDDDPQGKLYGLDVSIGDLPRGALAGGTVRKIRVLEGLPVLAGAPASPVVPRRLLGEAPVAGDGSFHVRVPANVPLQLQILDADGLALASGAWIWTRNHYDQGCVGCHENPELAPPNRFAEALAAPAADLTPDPAMRRTVDFRHDVQAILEAQCLGCHAARGSPPDLSGDAYAALVPVYARPGSARTSPLIWHLLGRNTSRPWDGDARERPVRGLPDGAPPIDGAARRTLVEWIDSGATRDAGTPPARTR